MASSAKRRRLERAVIEAARAYIRGPADTGLTLGGDHASHNERDRLYWALADAVKALEVTDER